METDTMPVNRVHQGHNIKRFRDILNIKQDILAEEVGISQQTMSKLEKKSVIDEKTLEKVAKALKIPVEALRNMPEEGAVNIIANTFNTSDHAFGVGDQSNDYRVENPIEKITELYERIVELERELALFRNK